MPPQLDKQPRGSRNQVRRSYSAASPPPVRGFVVTVIRGDDDEICVHCFPICAISLCEITRWVPQDAPPPGQLIENSLLTPNQLREAGYRAEFPDTEVVPLVLFTPGYCGPHDEVPAEERQLVLLSECEMYCNPHQIVWCDWHTSEDEQRLEPTIRRLRAMFSGAG